MGLEFEKIAALEDVARELNHSRLRWAVTNGLGEYPDSIGRDLDVLVEGPLDLAVGHVIKVLESAGWVVLPNRQGWIWWIVAFRESSDGSLISLQVDLFKHLQWAFTWVVDKVGNKEDLIRRGPFYEDPVAAVGKRFMLHVLSTGVTKFREKPAYLDFSERELAVLPSILTRLSGRHWPEIVKAVSSKDLTLLESELGSFRRRCLLNAIWTKHPIARLASAIQKQWVVNLFPRQGAPVIELTSGDDCESRKLLETITEEFRNLVYQEVQIVEDSAKKKARHWCRLSCLQVVLIFVNTPVPAGLKAEITLGRDEDDQIYWKSQGLDSRCNTESTRNLKIFLLNFFKKKSSVLKEQYRFGAVAIRH